jgi:hypothetical protein
VVANAKLTPGGSRRLSAPRHATPLSSFLPVLHFMNEQCNVLEVESFKIERVAISVSAFRDAPPHSSEKQVDILLRDVAMTSVAMLIERHQR